MAASEAHRALDPRDDLGLDIEHRLGRGLPVVGPSVTEPELGKLPARQAGHELGDLVGSEISGHVGLSVLLPAPTAAQRPERAVTSHLCGGFREAAGSSGIAA